MAENKYYPIRIRNEEERIMLDNFLELCRQNNSDGSTEIRKFMKRYISRCKNKNQIKDSTDNETDNIKQQNNQNKETSKSVLQEYLKKIGYEPSYLKKNKN